MKSSIACLLAIFVLTSIVTTSTVAAATNSGEDSSSGTSFNNNEECINMREVSTLQFEFGNTENRQRTSNVPRLQCQGNCPSEARLESAHCTKQGTTDTGMPTWRCVPSFSPINSGKSFSKYGLGNIRVECEGCNKRGDKNIRIGTCSLRYSIVEMGMRRHRGKGMMMRSSNQQYQQQGGEDAVFSFMISVLLLTTICGMCYMCGKRRGQHEGAMYAQQQQQYGPDGKPLPMMGYPVSGGAYPHGGGYGGGGGFGTGMFTGFLLGDMMSRGHGGGVVNNNYYGDDGGDDGGYFGGGDDGGSWGGGDGGGFGGMDSL